MKSLTNSKTMWGFGIAILLSLVRVLLPQFGIVIEETTFDAISEVVIYAASMFGVYGVRDAMRKIHIEYYNSSGSLPK